MKGKIMMMVLLCALLVGLVPPGSAHAEEVPEWSDFAEWCYYNNVDMSLLPVEYDSSNRYMLATIGKNGSYKIDYLITWDVSADPGLKFKEATYDYLYYNPSSVLSVYKIQYKTNWYDYEGWNGVELPSGTSSTFSSDYKDFKYTDVCVPYSSGGVGCVAHRTSTGSSVDFQFAKADITEDLLEVMNGYSNYVVAKLPYRSNEWNSEQIMVVVSNGNNVILRDNNGKQIWFTTGTGYESGKSYIYCSNCCYWNLSNSSKAYVLGDGVDGSVQEPALLYSSCDIYLEGAEDYSVSDTLWRSAIPYDSSVTPTPIPSRQEVVTSGFPRLFEVTDNIGLVRAYADSDSNAVVALGKGKGGLVYGVAYDNSGDAWYEVGLVFNGIEYEGYILASSVYVGYSAPSAGGSESGGSSGDGAETPSPSVPPSAGSDVEVPKFNIDWNNIKLDDIPEVVGQIKDAVLGFFDIVGVVPLMIGAVFGFLPSWCLWMFGLSFALLGVLLVIKLIRG